MSDLLIVAIGLGAACIILGLFCDHLSRKIRFLEMVFKKHDEEIQDLYTRKANRQPVIETLFPPDKDKEAVIQEMSQHISDYIARRKHPL